MWLEIKALFTGFAIVCVCVLISQLILYSMFLGFLGFMAIGFLVIGDILIGYRLVSTKGKYWIERPPAGKELGVILTLTGLIDLVWSDKKPEGKREFVYNNQEASVINTGDYPIHTLAGARGFIGHESCDTNINLYEARAIQEWSREFNTTDIKELYAKAKAKDGGK